MRTLFLFLFFFLSLEAKPLNVKVSAKAAVLMNAETGEVLFEKDAHTLYSPGSITKIATAVYVVEKKGHALDEKATVHHDCIMTVHPSITQAPDSKHPPYRLESDGTMMYLHKGEELPLRSLLHGLMMRSGNDAANVLAHHISGGDINRFMEEVNQYLYSKGIRNTRFLNPSGLPNPKHVTTAYDMALMGRELLKKPVLREIVGSVRAARPKTDKQPAGEFIQANALLKPGPYYYPKAIGIKTGRTFAGGYTLVAGAEHEGRTLIAVLLGCETRGARYQDAIKLFEAAFAEKPVIRTLFTKKHDHFPLVLKGSKTPLDAVLERDLIISYFPAEEPKFKAQVRWNRLQLPIMQGQEIGRLELITDKGAVLQSAPLFATRALEKTAWQAFVDWGKQHRKLLVLSVLMVNVLGALAYYLKKARTGLN